MRSNISGRYPYVLLTALSLLLLGSCATLFRGSGNSSVYITSNVQDAQVFNSKRKLLGKTPLRIDVANKANQNISIEKEGYTSQSKEIAVKEMPGYVFLDAMLLGIPYFIDKANHAIEKPVTDKIDAVLKRKWDPKGEKIPSVILDVSWKIPEKTILGMEDKENIYFKKSHFDSYMYQSTLCSEMQETRYPTGNCDHITDEDYHPIIRPGTLFIQPEIIGMSLFSFKRKGVENKTCDLQVKWKFSLSRDEFVIHEVVSKVSVTKEMVDKKRLVTDCLVRSFYEIADDDALFDTLMKNHFQSDFTYFKEAVTIPHITIPSYEKNKDLIKYMMNAVVTIELDNGGHGSGFFISEDGYLLTNYHVVKKQKQVNVRLGNSIALTGEVVRVNEGFDMALLKVTGNGFTALPLGNSDSLETGEDVLAIGTPEDLSLGQSVSKGIVSGKRKFGESVYIQTDVSINRGNSGGPLLLQTGEAMGMVTLKLIGEGTEGINFCIPSNKIAEVLNISYK